MSINVCAECGAVISMSEVRGLCCSADPTHFGMLQPREMESEITEVIGQTTDKMTAEETADVVVHSLLHHGHTPESRRDLVLCAIIEAEERGYQRGKAGEWEEEAIILRRLLDKESKKTAHLTRQLIDMQPCEWEDLKGLEGEALRDRLKDRTFSFRHCMGILSEAIDDSILMQDKKDMRIVYDIVLEMERNCTMEVDRLWEIHLQDLTTWYIEEDPSYVVLLEMAGNPQYAHIIVERAAQRRLQEATKPTEETLMDIYERIADMLALVRTKHLMGEHSEALGLFNEISLQYSRYEMQLRTTPGFYALEHALNVTMATLNQDVS